MKTSFLVTGLNYTTEMARLISLDFVGAIKKCSKSSNKTLILDAFKFAVIILKVEQGGYTLELIDQKYAIRNAYRVDLEP